ncbi:MAG TPA: site-2 protease family protein [Anaerolineales bacterium]|nr:site-2 protease family protein [Anaerolineales bacterium]
MKCDRCGIQSDVEQAFSTEKRLLRKAKHFCPDCAVKRQARSFVSGLVIIAGCGILIFLLNPFSGALTIILESYLIVLCMIPLVVIHELSHAGTAQLTGLRTFGIVIGIGKTIWSGKIFGMDWIINILPIAGITGIGARPVPYIRWKLFFVYLAGPASHLLMMLVFSFLWLLVPSWMLVHRLFGPLIIANILLAIVSLFPQKVSTLVGMQGTDGWQLLHVLFLNESEITKHYISYFAVEAMHSYAANDFGSAKKWVDKALALDGNSGMARNVLGVIQMACGEHRASRATFVQLLDTEAGKEPGLHYMLLNNIAYLDALLHDATLLPEADQFSAEALKHLAWVPAIVGTRGTVLVELGQLDEGIGLLKKSMSRHSDKQGKALNACHVAVGELRRGDLDAAHKYLASAKMLDPTCFLITEVEAQIMGKTIDD